MAATLVIRRGEGAGSEHPLNGEVVIGRERGSADLVLDDPGVSRRHAAVRAEGGRITSQTSDRPTAPTQTAAASAARPSSPTATRSSSAGPSSPSTPAPPATAPAPGRLAPSPARRQPSGLGGRLDDEGNIPALAAVFLGPLSIFLLIASTGAAFFVSLPCAIGAIVLGNMGNRRVDRGEADSHRTLASIGRITGIVGTVLSVLAIAAWIAWSVVLDVAERQPRATAIECVRELHYRVFPRPSGLSRFGAC